VLTEKGTLARNGNRTLLSELEQRIRDVRQGPDGLLYLAIDESQGAVVRIEPLETTP
jgi:glucose/arabinose dehydrogenase